MAQARRLDLGIVDDMGAAGRAGFPGTQDCGETQPGGAPSARATRHRSQPLRLMYQSGSNAASRVKRMVTVKPHFHESSGITAKFMP